MNEQPGITSFTLALVLSLLLWAGIAYLVYRFVEVIP